MNINFVNNLNKPKTLLLLGNILLVFFLILFSNLGKIPFHLGDFLFFFFLALGFALYRPGWCFLLFIGTLPLENINLAPVELGINIRPYQFFGAITILAMLIRMVSGRLYFKLLKPVWFDWLVIIFALSGFLSAFAAFVETHNYASLRLAVVIGTFSALYYLVRNYIQNIDDLKRAVPFFLSSSLVVILYGIWQNWAFLHGWNHFEAMPGRPNATFTEPDWAGMFLVLLSGIIYVLIYSISNFEFRISSQDQMSEFSISKLNHSKLNQNSKFKIQNLFLYFLLVLTFILLILTVSRSAWLGAFMVYVMFVLIFFSDLRFRNWKWRETSWLKLKIISCLAVSVAMVYVFHLTKFQLFNRAISTSGLQKITISCDQNMNLPAKIDDVAELAKYNCRHINLEEIESEKAQGKFVTEIERNDPNVATRREIYERSLAQIQTHPVLGIGWGSIGNVLGKDQRGTPLNSSNIFLEMWLGAGVLGFLSLVILLGYILFKSVRNYYFANDNLQKTVNLFIIISWFAIVIPNMFNAGIFLGIFWVWLAISLMETIKNNEG